MVSELHLTTSPCSLFQADRPRLASSCLYSVHKDPKSNQEFHAESVVIAGSFSSAISESGVLLPLRSL